MSFVTSSTTFIQVSSESTGSSSYSTQTLPRRVKKASVVLREKRQSMMMIQVMMMMTMHDDDDDVPGEPGDGVRSVHAAPCVLLPPEHQIGPCPLHSGAGALHVLRYLTTLHLHNMDDWKSNHRNIIFHLMNDPTHIYNSTFI